MSTTSLPDALSPAAREFAEKEHQLLIDGEYGPAADNRVFVTEDPGTGRPIADIALGGEADVDRAVAAARAALEGDWARIPAADRGRLLARLADLVEEHAAELARSEEHTSELQSH